MAVGAISSATVEAILHDLDPPELVAPALRRLAATGFVTEDVLARLRTRLQRHLLAVDDPLVVDLGCGAGGVGLWLAEKLRTRLVGIDADHVAVRRARRQRARFGLAYEPAFHRATFEWTGLAPAIVHAIVSSDALHRAAPPAAALAEARRVLAPGGVLAFDVYVPEDDRHAWRWVRHLLDAGFDVVELDDQTAAWRAVARAKYANRLACAAYLARRLGPRAAALELARSRDILERAVPATRRLELVAMSRG